MSQALGKVEGKAIPYGLRTLFNRLCRAAFFWGGFQSPAPYPFLLAHSSPEWARARLQI